MPTTLAVTGHSAVPEVVEESIESPLSGVVASITEFKTVGTLPRERVKAEPIRATTKNQSDDMPKL